MISFSFYFLLFTLTCHDILAIYCNWFYYMIVITVLFLSVTCDELFWTVFAVYAWKHKNLRPFEINYSFIIKTTTKKEMREVVIILLICWISKFFKMCQLLIKHISFSTISFESSFSPLLFIFLEADMRWRLSLHRSSWFSSSKWDARRYRNVS